MSIEYITINFRHDGEGNCTCSKCGETFPSEDAEIHSAECSGEPESVQEIKQ